MTITTICTLGLGACLGTTLVMVADLRTSDTGGEILTAILGLVTKLLAAVTLDAGEEPGCFGRKTVSLF